MKICFFGHRMVLQDIRNKLKAVIISSLDEGHNELYVGHHGDFDKIVLQICRELKKLNYDISIYLVLTSISKINNNINGIDNLYSDINIISYDIESVYYKEQIIYSNKKVVDNCDKMICYVKPNSYKSGASSIMKYALNKGKQVINIYYS